MAAVGSQGVAQEGWGRRLWSRGGRVSSETTGGHSWACEGRAGSPAAGPGVWTEHPGSLAGLEWSRSSALPCDTVPPALPVTGDGPLALSTPWGGDGVSSLSAHEACLHTHTLGSAQ